MLNPVECFVFKGCQSKGEQFSFTEANDIAQQLHGSYDHWIGQWIPMHFVPCTLRDAHGELKLAKESIREWNVERLGMMQSPAHQQPTSPWEMDRGRGYIQQSNRYFASQYLSQERIEERSKHSKGIVRPGQTLPIPTGLMS